jgi:hypothetical protein
MVVKHFQVTTFDRRTAGACGSIINAVLAKSQIGVEEYLDLVFPDRPEPDYVHGEVVERALPTPLHSQIQSLLTLFFAPLLNRVRVILMSELRVRIDPRVFRVVDFADPQLKRLYEYTDAGLLPHRALRLAEFDFEISAQELFKDI